MKAIVHHRYGSPDVLEYADVAEPTAGDGEVLVRVHSAALNPLDWHFMTGTPMPLRLMAGLRKPKQPIRGVDFAGVVESIGDGVDSFSVGDEVFGSAHGAFAERVAAKADRVVPRPDSMGFDEAAALPVAAITALQALRDHAGVSAGQRVLINGSSGGVGTYAVQIAKAMGAEVTAVCSTRNLDLVRSLGADHVIDYVTDDFADTARRYDVLVDNVGNRSLGDCRRVLTDDGIYLTVGAGKEGRWIGALKRPVAAKLRFLFGSKRTIVFTAEETAEDMQALADMVHAGKLRSVIDSHYPLADGAEAMRHLATWRARGKIILTVAD